MNEWAVCQEIFSAHGEKSAPDELLLFREGKNDYTGFPSITMDAESAEKVISFFNDRGVDIPVDFEHSTIHKASNGEPAPAVGWIVSLRYEKGVGLLAKVKWLDSTKELIESERYKYHSPVAKIDKKTNKVVSIHSVALTNSPRTKKMNELLAAALSAESEGTDMPKSKKKKADDVTLSLKGPREKLNKTFRMLIGGEEVIPGIEVDTAELPDEQVEELDEVGQKLEELKSIVVEAAEGTGDETAVEIIDMAIALITGGAADEGESDEDIEASKKKLKLAATLCAKLGVKDSNMEKAIKKVDQMIVGSVPAGEFKKVQGQLKELQAAEDSRNADTLVAGFVETGQLNPNDEDKMTWALKCALDSPENFETLMVDAPVLFTPGKVTKMDGGGNPRTERSTLIASLSSEFDDNPKHMTGLKKKGYINSCLYSEDMTYLDEKELETLKISG